MIQPVFNFDLTQSYTSLVKSIAGAAGVANATDAPVPTGVNRLFLTCSVYHTDGAASHILGIALVDPSGNIIINLATDTGAIALPASARACVSSPFVVPPGWVLTVGSIDAIGAGAVVNLRGQYLDYLIR